MVDFTIGVDPEVFVKLKDKPVSAHGLVQGTKESPFPIKNGAYQVDGMALEFNTDPVSLFGHGCCEAFEKNIYSVFQQLRDAAKKANPDISLSLVPVQEFSQEVLDNTPDEAKELGCNPDYNAYTGELNPRPKGEDVNFRTASGHVHIGWGSDIPADHPDHIKICCDFVKILDLVVGLYMTVIDAEPRRRELYGKAGAFRPKSYGVEYRTPSNLWLKNKTRRRNFHRLVQVAVTLHRDGFAASSYNSSEEEVREIINNGDFIAAYKLLRSVTKSKLNREHRDSLQAEFAERCKAEDKEDLYEELCSTTKTSPLDVYLRFGS